MTFAIIFPQIDPVLIAFGPIAIRWYSLAYIAGLVLGWRYLRFLAARSAAAIKDADIDDYLVWATMGVIFGGRLGYVLFYQFGYFFDNMLQIFAVWRGGMSFHGGFLGGVILSLIFCRQRKIPPLIFGDLVACVAPIGLFFGRLANFINGELFGRVSDAPWAIVFPRGGPFPRHPSQLYEAALEGLVLFLLLALVWCMPNLRQRAGLLTGVFVTGYATSRTIVEFFRQPDEHLGFLTLGATMGQWLTLPMFLVGLFLIVRAKPKKMELQGQKRDKTG